MSDSYAVDGKQYRGWKRRIVGILLLLIVLAMLYDSLVMVDETEYVLVERFGSLSAIYDRPEERGLHWKLPWPIDTVRRFDRRIQLLDPPGRELFTADRQNIVVDVYLCWKIGSQSLNDSNSADETDVSRPVVQFYRSFGSIDRAENRLSSLVHSSLTNHLGKLEFQSLLTVENSRQGPNEKESGVLVTIGEEIHRELNQRLHQTESEGGSENQLGIEIVDVRIKRLNFPVGNHQAVYERMRSERRKIADGYRSSGQAEVQVIRSRADRQFNDILTKARAEAETIRGSAEAEAIGILNEAHAQHPEFYRVLRTLDAYQSIINEKTTLILSADSPLLKLLTSGLPNNHSDSPQQIPGSNKSSAPMLPDQLRKPSGDLQQKSFSPARGERP